MAEAVCHLPLIPKAWVRSQASLSYLLWTVFIPEYFYFPLSGSFYHCSVLAFIWMLFWPERQRDDGWEWPKGSPVAKVRELVIPKYFHLFFRLHKTATGFSLRTSIFPHHYHSTNASYSSSSCYSFTRKVNWWSPDTFKKQCFSQKSQNIG
jgi:hypothetical protein